MRNHRKMRSQVNPGLRQRQRAGCALGDGPEGLPIRFRAWAGLRLAIFFSAGVVALVRPGGVQAADGLCPNEGGARGRVASVNERLELILEDGNRLKIAGVDPPRPTPGDPELDIRARDRLAQWLTAKKYSSARLNRAWIGGGARRPLSSPPRRDRQTGQKRRPCRWERRSSMQVSRATSQARRRAWLPCLPPRPAHAPRGLAFGPIRIMRSSPRPIARPSPRKPAQPSF